MPIPLGRTAAFPGIKFRQPGQYVDIAICNVELVPWNDYQTGQPKRNDAGEIRQQELVTGVFIRGTGVITSDDSTDVVPAEGTIVAIYCAGHHRWDFIQAQKKLDGRMNVGDVMRVKFTGEEPGQGSLPKKVWSFMLRHPQPGEEQRTAQCEGLYAQLNSEAASSSQPAQMTLTSQPLPEDEEPF